MNRREVLIAAGIAPFVLAGRLYAAPAAKKRFLIVFLRGAYDAANVLVPISSDFYYRSRPTIAVPKPGADMNAALQLDEDWGLHPALRETIHPLYMKGEA